jgi:hypothetical protein
MMHHRLQRTGQFGVEAGQQGRFGAGNEGHRPGQGLVGYRIGQLPRQQLAGQQPQGVHVRGRAHLVPAGLLRAHVTHRTQQLAHHGEHVGAGGAAFLEAGDAEVQHAGCAVGPDDDVVGFQIAVGDPGLVGMAQGSGDFPEKADSGLVVGLVLLRPVQQGGPRHELGGHEGQRPLVGGQGAVIHQLDDAWVLQAPQDLGFLLEACPGPRWIRIRG